MTLLNTPTIDHPLLLSTFLTGTLDAAIYGSFSVFASMQTGNTIFLALGASSQPPNRPWAWLKSLTSISAFIIGVVLFTLLLLQLPKRTAATATATATAAATAPPTSRHLSFAWIAQMVAVFVAAGLVRAGVPAKGWAGELPVLGLVAAQSGGQMACGRLLALKEIPTTVLTSVYCDLSMGVVGGEWWGRGQGRRGGAVVAILVGGVMGGWLTKLVGLEGALWVVGAGKGLCAGWWVLLGYWEERRRAAVERLEGGCEGRRRTSVADS